MAIVVTSPLVLASSAFMPVQTMPGWLQAIAKATPILGMIAVFVRSPWLASPASSRAIAAQRSA
ncbi:MAG: hypothetical protein ACRD0K_00280 [Egibacteraceae bacterium]